MQMNEQVLTALEVLRNFAENDFEKQAIRDLEKKISHPVPQIEILDDKHCVYEGKVYKPKTNGYFVRTEYLHIKVWENYNGELPKESVVHHKDINNQNNEIDNLQAMTVSEHTALHSRLKGIFEKKCMYCGKNFIAEHKTQKYCSSNCRNRGSRKKEIRKCIVCGKEFEIESSRITRTCSRKCGGVLASRSFVLDGRERDENGRFKK